MEKTVKHAGVDKYKRCPRSILSIPWPGTDLGMEYSQQHQEQYHNDQILSRLAYNGSVISFHKASHSSMKDFRKLYFM